MRKLHSNMDCRWKHTWSIAIEAQSLKGTRQNPSRKNNGGGWGIHPPSGHNERTHKTAISFDKVWCDKLLERLPTGGVLIFDLGFFKFLWFDEFTESKKFFVTRLREKTSHKVLRGLSSGQFYRIGIIQMGDYRSNPCKHPVRLVSVLWGSTWYNYLTNVLEESIVICPTGMRIISSPLENRRRFSFDQKASRFSLHLGWW